MDEKKTIFSEPEEVIPQIIYPAETIAQFDIAVVINAIYQQNIEPTREGRVPKRIFNKIRPLLKGKPRPDYDAQDLYLEILLDILQVQEIIQLAPPLTLEGKNVYEPGNGLTWWQVLDTIQQTGYLTTLWYSHGAWRELAGVNFAPWDVYTWQPIMGRDRLTETLKGYKPERWYPIASLLETIWQNEPFAMRPHLAQMRNPKKIRELHGKWLACDGETYIGMLSTTLHELGIVSLGYEEEPNEERLRNPYAFMVTEFGANILSLIEQPPENYVPPERSRRTLIVQPSFELLLLEPDFPTLYKALPFTQVQQIGVASRLTLTRASVLRAIERGSKVDILAELEAYSQKELPQNVVYTLKDWVKDYKEVAISQVYLLEVDSEEIADYICNLPKLQKLLLGLNLRKIAPCLLTIDSNVNLTELKRLLEKEGIAVKVNSNSLRSSYPHTGMYGISS